MGMYMYCVCVHVYMYACVCTCVFSSSLDTSTFGETLFTSASGALSVWNRPFRYWAKAEREPSHERRRLLAGA